MNNRAILFSIIAGLTAVFFMYNYVSSVDETAKKRFGTEVLVVKASRNIKEMETLDETMVRYELVPKNYLEPSAISPPDMSSKEDKESAQVLKNLTGSIAVVPIRRGEQITRNKITDPSIRTGLAPQIAPGKRGIAVPVNETSGVSKLIKPGDRVDVMAVIDAGSGRESKLVKTIMQDVSVLSIGRYITNNAARSVEADPNTGDTRIRALAEDFSFSSVTLEVDPSQAQVLALLLGAGDNSLTFALRNNEDSDRTPINALILQDVFGAGDLNRARGAAKH